MLTDAALKSLKSKGSLYKVADRDGLYVAVAPSGAITFRLDYRLNGRRETLIIGRYGPSGISLARAREKCLDARRAVAEGRSPAQDKQREKRRLKEATSFGEFGKRWLKEAKMADSTRAMRRAIFERDVLPAFKNRLLTEIAPEDLRTVCAKVKARGAPATAVHARDIVKLVYDFAILHGEKVANPANEVGPASIATFVPKDRSLSPTEIRIMLKQLEHVTTLPTIRFGMRLYLLTMARPTPRSASARSRPERASLYQEITDKIIAELEVGRLPWVQPWGTAAAVAPLAMPKNAATGRQYSGVNVLILWGAVVEQASVARAGSPSARRSASAARRARASGARPSSTPTGSRRTTSAGAPSETATKREASTFSSASPCSTPSSAMGCRTK